MYSMVGIKTILVSVVVSAAIAFTAAWKYQDHKFNREIENAARIHAEELQKETKRTLTEERKNANLTLELDKKSAEASKRITELSNTIDSYRNANRGLYIRANSVLATGATNSTSSPSTDSASTTSTGICELPRDSSDLLSEAFRRADESRAYSETAYRYAQEVMKQRERLSNER